jgi:hypothetical protein
MNKHMDRWTAEQKDNQMNRLTDRVDTDRGIRILSLNRLTNGEGKDY